MTVVAGTGTLHRDVMLVVIARALVEEGTMKGARERLATVLEHDGAHNNWCLSDPTGPRLKTIIPARTMDSWLKELRSTGLLAHRAVGRPQRGTSAYEATPLLRTIVGS